MSTVGELLEFLKTEEQAHAAQKERADKYKRFYASKAWAAAKYRWMIKQTKPLRCAACGATAQQARLCTDHVIPIRTPEGWNRRLEGPFQCLCNEHNLAKGSWDQTDWRVDEKEKQHADIR
jgi:hypothetical protein